MATMMPGTLGQAGGDFFELADFVKNSISGKMANIDYYRFNDNAMSHKD